MGKLGWCNKCNDIGMILLYKHPKWIWNCTDNITIWDCCFPGGGAFYFHILALLIERKQEIKIHERTSNVIVYWLHGILLIYELCLRFCKQYSSLRNESYIINWVSCNLISLTIISHFLRFWSCRRLLPSCWLFFAMQANLQQFPFPIYPSIFLP